MSFSRGGKRGTMKASQFKQFRETLIKNQFDVESDIFYCGYLWLSLTDKQVSILRNDVIRHAVDFTINANTGDITVGMYILKK